MDKRYEELLEYIFDRGLTQAQIDLAIALYYQTTLTPAEIFQKIS